MLSRSVRSCKHRSPPYCYFASVYEIHVHRSGLIVDNFDVLFFPFKCQYQEVFPKHTELWDTSESSKARGVCSIDTSPSEDAEIDSNVGTSRIYKYQISQTIESYKILNTTKVDRTARSMLSTLACTIISML